MSTEVTQNSDKRYIASDPSDLEVGDEVIVTEEGEVDLRGTVEETSIEVGRYAVTVTDEGGTSHRCWERTGRAFTRIEKN